MLDNRNYFYRKDSFTERVEFPIIKKIVGKNRKVIDLGCGDGSLIQILESNCNKCKGVELSRSGVNVCRKKGLDVNQGQIDTKLPFGDKEFDIAVCNVTIHMVMYPEVLIKEMQRISKKQIITFPNFAFVVNRLQFLFLGTFPKWSLFGYNWYSTGHIHQLSIKDFRQFCSKNNIQIVGEYHLFPKPIRKILLNIYIISLLLKRLSNLLATMAIFEVKS